MGKRPSDRASGPFCSAGTEAVRRLETFRASIRMCSLAIIRTGRPRLAPVMPDLRNRAMRTRKAGPLSNAVSFDRSRRLASDRVRSESIKTRSQGLRNQPVRRNALRRSAGILNTGSAAVPSRHRSADGCHLLLAITEVLGREFGSCRSTSLAVRQSLPRDSRCPGSSSSTWPVGGRTLRPQARSHRFAGLGPVEPCAMHLDHLQADDLTRRMTSDRVLVLRWPL